MDIITSKGCLCVIDEGDRSVKRSEPLQNEPSLNTAWTNPMPSDPESNIPTSGLVVNNMKGHRGGLSERAPRAYTKSHKKTHKEIGKCVKCLEEGMSSDQTKSHRKTHKAIGKCVKCLEDGMSSDQTKNHRKTHKAIGKCVKCLEEGMSSDQNVSVWRLQRACGMAPIRLVQLRGSSVAPNSFLIQGSFYWAVYSIALGVTVLPCAFAGLINDYFNALGGLRTARMETDTDVIVTFFDIVTIIMSAGVSIGFNVYNKRTILFLLKQLTEIDALLGWHGPERLTRWPIVILAVLVIQLFLDAIVWINIGMGFALTLPYFPFYVCYFILFAEETAFVNDSTALDARFRRLNCQLTASVKYRNNGLLSQSANHTVPGTYVGNEVNSIRRLAVAHSRLCDATQTTCRRHGIPILVDVIGMLLHLVITAYFFITQLVISKGSPSAAYQIIQGLWVLAHMLRLLQIVVPCSEASKEANQTGIIVGKLLNTATSPATNKQLEYFSIQLMHSNANFSACGFITLDLPLVVSVMAAVTTYLVVLIQFKVPSTYYTNS